MLAIIGQHWSSLVNVDHHWSMMINVDQQWFIFALNKVMDKLRHMCLCTHFFNMNENSQQVLRKKIVKKRKKMRKKIKNEKKREKKF